MQIQPVQPMVVNLKCGQNHVTAMLVELTDTELHLTSTDYLDKDSVVSFRSQFFYGEAIVTNIHFQKYRFHYTLTIETIKYQPGLLINKQL